MVLELHGPVLLLCLLNFVVLRAHLDELESEVVFLPLHLKLFIIKKLRVRVLIYAKSGNLGLRLPLSNDKFGAVDLLRVFLAFAMDGSLLLLCLLK